MKTQKRLLGLLVAISLIATFFVVGNLAYLKGKSHVIDNGIIYDMKNSQGVYHLEIDGETYDYWNE